jgi:hypothetical protein
VVIAKAEYEGSPPLLVRGSAFQAATASGVNHTVKLPRARRPSSYSARWCPVLLLGDMMAAIRLRFERQEGWPCIEEGMTSPGLLLPKATQLDDQCDKAANRTYPLQGLRSVWRPANKIYAFA